MSVQTFEQERAPAWWREHWLENCQEFGVERSGEQLGFVEEVEQDADGEADALVIEAGARRVRIAVAEVVAIDPYRCLVTLRPAA